MDILEKARKDIADLKESFKEEIKKTFSQQKKIIVKYNAEEQLYKLGEDSKGSVIRPKYAESTISIKKAKGQPYNRVTLKDTGEFHKSLTVVAHDDYVEIYSDSLKTEGLFEKYGEDILGIQEALMKEFIELYVLPNMKERAKKKLGL